MTWLFLLLACSSDSAPPPPAPPPPAEVRVPEPATPAETSPVTPHAAQTLGVLIVWNKTEKSRDSHSLGTRLRLQDHEVSVTYSASGRARGRAKDALRFQLTDEQLAEIVALVDELGLDEPRDVVGASPSSFTTIKGTCTVFLAGETRKTSIEAKPHRAPPSLGQPPPAPAEARDDPAYKAVQRLIARIERMGKG